MPETTGNAPDEKVQDPQQGSTTGEAPTVEPSGDKPTPSLQDTGFRYQAGEGVPSYLVGKTAKEAAQLVSDMYSSMVAGTGLPQQTATGPQYQQPQQQQYNTASAPAPAVPDATGTSLPTQDDFLNDPATATQRWGQHMWNTQVLPELQQRDLVASQQATALARMEYKESFDRWGPEIELQLRQVPAAQLTPQNIKLVVEMIQGRHAREVNQEEVEARARELVESNTLRSTAGATVGTEPSQSPEFGIDLESKEIDITIPIGDEDVPFQEACKRFGITPRHVDEFIHSMFKSLPLSEGRKKYFNMLKKKEIVSEGAISG